MTHADLTVLINTMDDEKVEHLLALFADVDMTVTHPPQTGMIMMTVTDSFDTDFYPGEILVTEARIAYAGYEGFGMVPGEDPRRALARAAADAVLRCPEPCGITDHLLACLEAEEGIHKTRLAQNAALIAATRVNFDLMPGA